MINEIGTSTGKMAFQELLDEIISRRMQPEDKYEIAAILESLGWNDTRVNEAFGAADVFELASDLWNSVHKKIISMPYERKGKYSFVKIAEEIIRNFIRGLIFAFPMAISVFSMLVLKFSLWSYQYLSLEEATCIAIGTILSFMVIGGFMQAIARRGFFYITQNYYDMAKNITISFIKIGYIVCFIISAALLIFDIFFEIFPIRMMMIINLYFFFLSTIWLSTTVMYILKREFTFTVLISTGIFIVYILFKVIKLDIFLSQIISLITVSALGIILIIYFFKIAEKNTEKGISPTLPKASITLYSVMPYFFYGFLYFTFFFTDRIIAWSTNSENNMSYFIWFKGPYELGLDLAILMFVLPMGINEVSVWRLLQNLETGQKKYRCDETGKLCRHFLKVYLKRLALVSILYIVIAILVYIAVEYIDQRKFSFIGITFLENNLTRFVFILALLSYSFVSVALMNSVILFSLARPEIVNRSILGALIVNIIIGFLSSRWVSFYNPDFGYGYAVFGLLAGSIVFVILTSMGLVKVFKSIDYYLYVLS